MASTCKRFRNRLAVGALLLSASITALYAGEVDKSTHMVAMRDGTRLATDVYLPPQADRPFPAIVVRGPYGKNGIGSVLAERAIRNGYALVVQDMRGRFDSEGSDAVVFHNDGWSKNRDGHDTILWTSRQAWCDGKIATWGGSALGITQNMAAIDAPEVLRAQYVQVAFSNMYLQGAYQGGVWRKSLIEPWLAMNGFDPGSLETFLAHARYDEFWEELDPAAQAHRAHAPAIFWGGWYDIFLQGTIESFVALHNRGKEPARGNCRLIIGPWAHGNFGGLTYPENASQPPKAQDPFRFFEHWVKGEDNHVPDDLPVHYYVMGDPTRKNAAGNFWRSAESWPPPAEATPLFFHPDRSLKRTPAGRGERELSYQYDPNNPAPTVGGQNLFLPKGPMDQRKVEARDDVLVFTSPPLEQPMEVSGPIEARLFVSSDCPDTDFAVKLTDVYPDGRSMLVTDGILRARFRESFRDENLLEPGTIYKLRVDLSSTSLIFGKGHRIRVAVSSSNSPRFEPNPNTGHPFRADDETRVATNTLHLSPSHASCIVLPLYNGADARRQASARQ